jgi:hypothetical protein
VSGHGYPHDAYKYGFRLDSAAFRRGGVFDFAGRGLALDAEPPVRHPVALLSHLARNMTADGWAAVRAHFRRDEDDEDDEARDAIPG